MRGLYDLRVEAIDLVVDNSRTENKEIIRATEETLKENNQEEILVEVMSTEAVTTAKIEILRKGTSHTPQEMILREVLTILTEDHTQSSLLLPTRNRTILHHISKL
jgi:hypothetical protein